MANILLKTLNIGGVAKDIDNDRFPHSASYRAWPAALAIPNHYYHYDVFTAPTKGIVFISASVEFEYNGYGSRNVVIDIKRNGGYVGTGAATIVSAPAYSSSFTTTATVVELAAGEGVSIAFAHGATANLSTAVSSRWVFVPDTL